MSETTPIKKIKGYENQLAGRLNRLALDFGDGITVVIQPLPYSVWVAIEAMGKDDTASGLIATRAAIVEITGMGDVPTEKLVLAGKEYIAPTQEWLESQIPGFVTAVSMNVNTLNMFGMREANAIDFT